MIALQQFRAIRKADGTMFGPDNLRVAFTGNGWETDNGLSGDNGDSLRLASPLKDRKGRLLFDGDVISMFPDHPEFKDKPEMHIIVYAHGSHWLYSTMQYKVFARLLDFRGEDVEYIGQCVDYEAIQREVQSQNYRSFDFE